MKAFFVICFGWNSEGFISALGCGSSFPWHFTQFHIIIRPDGFLSFWNMNTEFRKPCVTAVTSNHIVIVFWHVHGNSSTKGLEFLIVPILKLYVASYNWSSLEIALFALHQCIPSGGQASCLGESLLW